MAENIENTETQKQDLGNQDGQGQNKEQDPPKVSYTKEEVEALIKDAEAKGYGKGKFDTNAKWEKTAKEREKLAKEEAEKQARFEKMSELEKAQTQAKEAQEELVRLQDEMALTKQIDETRKMLEEQDLPTKKCFIRGVLEPKDAEATKENVLEFKAEFEAELQKRVEAKIKTHIPKQNSSPEDGGISEKLARQAVGL